MTYWPLSLKTVAVHRHSILQTNSIPAKWRNAKTDHTRPYARDDLKRFLYGNDNPAGNPRTMRFLCKSYGTNGGDGRRQGFTAHTQILLQTRNNNNNAIMMIIQ